MANTLAPFGFRHVESLSGGAPTFAMANRPILSTYSTKIYFGDVVVRTNATSPYITQSTGTGAATSQVIEGVFAGCFLTDSAGSRWSPYWPGAANVDANAYVINDPYAQFLVQALNTAISSGDIGRLIGFTAGTGSTAGMALSGATIDQSTLTTSTTAPFQVVGLYQGVGNGSDPTTAFNWAVVTFNNQRFRAETSNP